MLLTGARGLQRRVAAAARNTRSFTVGFMPGLTITAATRALSKAYPDVSVEVLRTDWTDQVTVLHDGRADVGFVRMPIDLSGLSTLSSFHEPHVAVVAATHPLAGRDTVGTADLVADDLLQNPDTVPEWKAVRRDAEYRAPSPAATVTGQHFYHQKPADVHPNARSVERQDALLDYCAHLADVKLP